MHHLVHIVVMSKKPFNLGEKGETITINNEMLERYNQRLLSEGTVQSAESISYPPQLILNLEAKDFYQMTIDDFTMINYEPIKPQLKLELGI